MKVRSLLGRRRGRSRGSHLRGFSKWQSGVETLEPRRLLVAIAWDGGGDGVNWNNANNWNPNQIPIGGDDVSITSTTFNGGTYTVQINGAIANARSLNLGGASGRQTLQANVQLALGTATSTVNANGVLHVTGASVTAIGGILNNQGTIRVSSGTIGIATTNNGSATFEGASALSRTFSNNTAGVMRLEANDALGNATLTSSDAISNNGLFELTNASAATARNVVLTMSAGQLGNGGNGVINVLPGTVAGGLRTITAAINNAATINFHAPTTAGRPGANHINGGTIATQPGGSLNLTLGGEGTSFTNLSTGNIDINGGSFTIAGAGQWLHNGGLVRGGHFQVNGPTLTLNSPLNEAATAGTLQVATGGVVLGPAPLTVHAGKFLSMLGGSVGAPLVNNGRLVAQGVNAVNGAYTSGAGSEIDVEAVNAFGNAKLTFGNSFTNNGTIELTNRSTTAALDAELHLLGGSLTNAAGRTILSTDAGAGAGGVRRLHAALNNQGTLQCDYNLDLSLPFANHANSGAIHLSNPLTRLTIDGVAATFANTGTLDIGTGTFLVAEGGTFNLNPGSVVSGGGTMSFRSTDLNLNANLSTAGAALHVQGPAMTVDGPGTLTNAAGREMRLIGATVNAPLVNQGSIRVELANAINGVFTSAPGSAVRVRGSTGGDAALTFAGGFTNHGAIEMTTVTAAGNPRAVTLAVTSGTLVNAPDGSILPNGLGGGGVRTIAAQVNNQGLIINASSLLVIDKPGADHVNVGTLDTTDGHVFLRQSGITPSFTNSGTVVLDGIVDVDGGAFVWGGGSVTGAGGEAHDGFTMQDTAVTVSAPLNLNGAFLELLGGSIAGTGSINVTSSSDVFVQSAPIGVPVHVAGIFTARGACTLSGALTTATSGVIQIIGADNLNATLTVANGFVNHAQIRLDSTATNPFNATLAVTNGTLVNAGGGRIRSLGSGAADGARAINALLDNDGLIDVQYPLTVTRAAAAHLNNGTIDVVGGNLTFAQSGATPSLRVQGASAVLNVAAGRTLTTTAGNIDLVQGGRLTGAGTVVTGALQNQNGVVTPGGAGAAGTLTVTGSYVQTAGTLRLDVGGLALSQFDRVLASLSAFVGGTMDVTPINGFDATSSTFLNVLTAPTVGGTFAQVTFTPTASGRGFGDAYTPTAARVTVGPTAPTVPDLVAASDTGVSGTDNVTRDTTPTFTGTAEPGGTVSVFANGNLIGTSGVGAGGNWTVTAAGALGNGTFAITASATDAEGDPSGASAPLNVTIDTVAPTLVGGAPTFHFQTAPHRLAYAFSESIGTTLGTADAVVERIGSGPVGFGVAYNAGNDVATLTFSGFAQGVLPDANFRATLTAAGVTDIAGNALASGNVFDFFFLRGDANHDGRVNLADFNVLATNFGQNGRDFTQGDFNYDGAVNLNDFNLLASRFGAALGPGAAAPSSPSSPRGRDALDDLLD